MTGRNELRVTVLALAGATMLVAPSAGPAGRQLERMTDTRETSSREKLHV